MKLEHVALWTNDLERQKAFYVQFFSGQANDKYINSVTGFESYFITFESGARLEIMQRPGIPDNLNDRIYLQHQGIIHMAFEVATMKEVQDKAKELLQAGFTILRGPRKTGDGYYEFETLDPDQNRLEVMALFVS